MLQGKHRPHLCDHLDFSQHPERRHYLCDLFEHEPDMARHALEMHGGDLCASARRRFAGDPNVVITQGKFPDVMHHVAPETIAFMHIDLNNGQAEIGVLEMLF